MNPEDILDSEFTNRLPYPVKTWVRRGGKDIVVPVTLDMLSTDQRNAICQAVIDLFETGNWPDNYEREFVQYLIRIAENDNPTYWGPRP